MAGEETVGASTDAGMLALWCGAAFQAIDDYEAWETRVNERLDDAVSDGDLVPVGIQSDGAFAVRVAVTPDGLTERERWYEVLTSEPYLLAMTGGQAFLSGVEAVGVHDSAVLQVDLPHGRYAVGVTLVAWMRNPGASNSDGTPGPTVLPDFVVQVTPETGTETYRERLVTFDPSQ